MTFFNRALWRKTFVESMILLVPCTIILFAFTCLFIYLMNRLKLDGMASFIRMILPADLLQLSSMRLDDWATRKGLLSMTFIHPVIEFTCITWAVIRGSAAISGEISRGTMEMLLAQPISRRAILGANAATAMLGCLVLPTTVLLGLAAGIRLFPPPEPQTVPLAASFYIPSALILAAYTFCLCGIATLISSWDHYRFRTIGLFGIFFVTQVIFDIAVRWADKTSALRHLAWVTIKTSFEPQKVLFVDQKTLAELVQKYCLTLIAVGVAAYVLAALIFRRRDLPTPL